MSRTDTRTYVAILTPDSRGAIAVVRVWGPDALVVADRVFRPVRGGPLRDTPPGGVRFGRVGAGLGDEVVATVIGGTDPPEVEIHGHGGPAAVVLVVDALVGAGAERRQPVAWVRHDARSTVAAEARVDLARAPTLRAAEILLEQAQGAIENELATVERFLIDDPAAALSALDGLIGRAAVGMRLTTGWSIVLAGRPNVGKSRLLNALAGYERAIVAPTPGTTRDVVTHATAFDGWPVELSDTAGLRDPVDAIEAEGVALARERHDSADLTVLVLDASEPLTDADRALLADRHDALIVANKADLPRAWDGPHQTISAATGQGLDALTRAIALRLVPAPPPPGAGLPFRPAHLRRLESARSALQAGDVLTAAQFTKKHN